MKKPIYYVGIYGTARETTAVIENSEGKTIGKGVSGVANIHFSVKHAWDNIIQATKQALGDLNPNEIELYAGIGIKNTELVESCQKLIALNKLFNKIKLASDAYMLCEGSNQDNAAIIIADEGLVGNVIIGKQLIKVGGWGFPHADTGSIPWIGLEAIHLTLQWIDGHIPETPLINKIYKTFDNDTAKLIDWAMKSRSNPGEYEKIAKIVFSLIKSNDSNINRILSKSAKEIEKVYAQLCLKSGKENIPLIIYGPIREIILPFLDKAIVENIIEPTGTALDGAIKLIRSIT